MRPLDYAALVASAGWIIVPFEAGLFGGAEAGWMVLIGELYMLAAMVVILRAADEWEKPRCEHGGRSSRCRKCFYQRQYELSLAKFERGFPEMSSFVPPKEQATMAKPVIRVRRGEAMLTRDDVERIEKLTVAGSRWYYCNADDECVSGLPAALATIRVLASLVRQAHAELSTHAVPCANCAVVAEHAAALLRAWDGAK